MSKLFRRGWISVHISMGVSSLKSYIDEMESLLSTQLLDLRERYEEETKHLSSEEAQIVYEYYYEDELYNFQTEFINILRKSSVISTYSFLEIELNRICTHIEKNNNFSTKLTDLYKKKGIFKSYYYLTAVANIDFSDLNTEWNKILKINLIRNHFIHNNNDVLNEYLHPREESQKKANKTLRAFKEFNIAIEDKVFNSFNKPHDIRKYDIILDENFHRNTLLIIEKFLDKLLNQLKLY